MSDTEQNEGGDITGAAAQGGEDNSILETLMAEIEKLKNENKHTKQALSAVTGNHGEASTSSNNAPSGPAQTPQVVYVSRERKIQKFSGIRKADDDTVENFVDNVKSLISARKMSQIEQTDFVLSLLESSAKEEVKLRPAAERDTSDKICDILLEAFGERRTTPQLLKSFYERKQKDTETLREFSHALCVIYNRIYFRDPTIIPSRDQALRDQFADNVRDSLLRKELKRMIRGSPSCKFLEVREEALHWAEEDEKLRPTKRNVSSEAVSTTQPNKEMDKVLQALEEQRKSIDNLSQTLISLSRTSNNTQRNQGRRGGRNPSLRSFDERGNIICFKCQGVGHIARECVSNTGQRHNEEHSPNVPPRTTVPPSSYVPNQDTSAPNGLPPQSRVGQ